MEVVRRASRRALFGQNETAENEFTSAFQVEHDVSDRQRSLPTWVDDAGFDTGRETTNSGRKRCFSFPPSPVSRPMAKGERIPEIDALRGLAIVLMALDHARDFFGDHSIDALDLDHTTIALFLARWLTHFCAPTFVCLAGMSVALASHRRPIDKTFLVGLATRGLWLVVLEQTLLRCFGWYFNFDYHYMNAGILWGTGWAMVFLALVLAVKMSPIWILILSGALMAGHELLARLVGNGWWSTMLLRSDDLESAGWHFYISYPGLPWFGLMAFGYGIAVLISLPRKRIAELRRTLALIGLVLLAVFLGVRSLNWGDPSPWTPQPQTLFTILSFVNLEKYPPSVDFSLMTLGVMFCFLAVIDFVPALMTRFLVTLGRVPLFFYLTHIVLIHLLAVVLAFIRFGHAEWLYDGPGIFWSETLPGHPANYGLSLVWVVLLWVLVIAILYPACSAYGRYKRLHDQAWLRYL
jgi:uncharacterized membrane protein